MRILKEVSLRTISIIRTHLCLFSNYKDYSVRLQYKNLTGFRNINCAASTVEKIISKILNAGNPGDKKVHYITEIDENKYFIKIFNNSNLILIVRDLFRASKAMKFYAANFEMHKRGIPVPEAVFILQKKFLLIKIRSIIATRGIENSCPFTQHYREWSENHTDEEKRYYLKKLADFIYLLNKKEIAHTDLLGNIMVKEESGKLQFILIDNDAVKLFDNLTKFDLIKHFEGFYWYFVKKQKVSEKAWVILCQEYIKLDNTTFHSVEELTRHVANRKNLLYYVIKKDN